MSENLDSKLLREWELWSDEERVRRQQATGPGGPGRVLNLQTRSASRHEPTPIHPFSKQKRRAPDLASSMLAQKPWSKTWLNTPVPPPNWIIRSWLYIAQLLPIAMWCISAPTLFMVLTLMIIRLGEPKATALHVVCFVLLLLFSPAIVIASGGIMAACCSLGLRIVSTTTAVKAWFDSMSLDEREECEFLTATNPRSQGEYKHLRAMSLEERRIYLAARKGAGRHAEEILPTVSLEPRECSVLGSRSSQSVGMQRALEWTVDECAAILDIKPWSKSWLATAVPAPSWRSRGKLWALAVANALITTLLVLMAFPAAILALSAFSYFNEIWLKLVCMVAILAAVAVAGIWFHSKKTRYYRRMQYSAVAEWRKRLARAQAMECQFLRLTRPRDRHLYWYMRELPAAELDAYLEASDASEEIDHRIRRESIEADESRERQQRMDRGGYSSSSGTQGDSQSPQPWQLY